ncbi:MAG: hypothetical protein J7J78_02840 [Thermoprotei archaeon]|nr:hypothetical protein [Thermoprotei archaeon]
MAARFSSAVLALARSVPRGLRAKTFGLYTWADRDYIKLPFSDEEFVLMLLNKFEEHVKHVYSGVNRIVAILHHVLFRKLVKYELETNWDYFSTYMVSESFSYVTKKYSDKIRAALYGHQHDDVGTMICKEVEKIKCCNCGFC